MSQVSTQKQTDQHYFIRTVFASIIGFLAVSLIILSILVSWLSRTLTDTDRYVGAVTKLVEEPGVQNFVVDRTTEALLNNSEAPVRDIATQLLGAEAVAGKADVQLQAALMPVVKENVRSVISSPQFETVWIDSNRSVHSQLVSQLDNDSSAVALNFRPVIDGVLQQLDTTKLNFISNNVKLKNDVGVVTLQGEKLSAVRSAYDTFNNAALALLVAAAVSLILCVALSVHHIKTFRRIALMTGVFTGALAIMLSASSMISVNNDLVQQQFVVALVSNLTEQLRQTLIIVSVVSIALSIGSKVYEVVAFRRT